MALIAFNLHQLYQQEKDIKYLSIDAYDAIGGVQGAVQQRAETALQGLGIHPETALPSLFANLVEVNEQEVATRRRAPQSILQGETITLAKALFVQLGIWAVPRPDMVLIPAGEFEMGDLSGNAGDSDERPVHRVSFDNAFKLGRNEVTFDEYDLFATATGSGSGQDLTNNRCCLMDLR